MQYKTNNNKRHAQPNQAGFNMKNKIFEIGTKVSLIYLGLQTTGVIIEFNPNKSNANIKFDEPIYWGNDVHYIGWVSLDNPYLKIL